MSFALHQGEIVGVGGLIGCGSEALALTLFGETSPDAGSIRLVGRAVRFRQPRDAIRRGVGFVPGDREREGLILNLSLERNIVAACAALATKGGLRAPRR